LAGIANDFDLPEQLASLIEKLLQTKMREEKLKEKQNNYLRPKNCEKMIPTRVNAAIWARLQSDTRSGVLKYKEYSAYYLKP
jgi:UDP-N-acetylglucosamine 2-epimerase